MTPRALLVSIVVMFVGACSTTQLDAVITPADVARMRAENPGDTLRVEIPTGNRLPEEARLVDVTADHTTLAISSEIATRVLPNDAITRVVVVHRGEGAAVGGLIGLAVGVAAAIATAATYSDPCAHSTSWGCISLPQSQMAELVGLVVGVPATALGAAIGAVAGVRTNYVFGPAPAPRAD